MILFTDDEQIEAALTKKMDNVTVYLIHHTNFRADAKRLQFAYSNKVVRIHEISIERHEGSRVGVMFAKLIYAEQYFSKREKIVYDFGDAINDEIFYILNPGKTPSRHTAKYDTAYKTSMVERWISQNKPPKATFAKQYGIKPATFSEWIKKWQAAQQIEPEIHIVNEEDISYYTEDGEHIPYYFSIDFHNQIYEVVASHNIILEHMEVCVLEDLLLAYGQVVISDDVCDYEPHTKDEFISHMKHYALSKRYKTCLPDAVLLDLWHVRNKILETIRI